MTINIIKKIKNNFINKKDIFLKKLNNLFKIENNEEYFNSLEEFLIKADIGITTTEKIIKKLKKNKYTDTNNLNKHLANILYNILKPCEIKFEINDKQPFVILVIGVNGVGKTTTIGKLANLFKIQGKNVLIAAGDTFRAAGIEQLEKICQKEKLEIIKQHHGADSASVLFDALNTAKSKKFDILIADTSGRLHTNKSLMIELTKIKKTLKKIDKNTPHEIIMVIDATFGQSSINQVKIFNDHINITGIIISKLDGTAKAGTIFSIADSLKKPIRYICNGEKINDIKTFNAKKYINNLLKTNI